MRRNKTLYDLALERNREEGQLLASRAAVTELAEAKFGPLPQEVIDRVAGCADLALLRQWLLAAGTLTTLDDFRAATGL